MRQRAAPSRDDMFWDVFGGWIDFIDGARPVRPQLPAGLADLVSESGVSRSTVLRRLNQAGGFKRQRQLSLVAAGLDLLFNTRDSVDAIAVELGYSDARSFRRFLKSATGKAPSEWRAGVVAPQPDRTGEALRRRVQTFARALDNQLRTVPL